MNAPVIDPNVALTADEIAALCDADRAAFDLDDERIRGMWTLLARVAFRVYGDVLPGDDRDDLDVWDEL